MSCIRALTYTNQVEPLPSMQGSTLSALLCNLYLADLENTHIRPLLPLGASGRPESGGGSASAAGYISALAAQAAHVAAEPASASQPRVRVAVTVMHSQAVSRILDLPELSQTNLVPEPLPVATSRIRPAVCSPSCVGLRTAARGIAGAAVAGDAAGGRLPDLHALPRLRRSRRPPRPPGCAMQCYRSVHAPGRL